MLFASFSLFAGAVLSLCLLGAAAVDIVAYRHGFLPKRKRLF